MDTTLLRKIAAPSILIVAVIFISYGTPRDTRHQPSNVLKKINLPLLAGDWQGEDVDEKLNLGEGYYAYIADMKTLKYVNPKGERIFFTLMDAGNFHHPRLCFQGAGYEPEDLPDTHLGANIHAPTIYFKKKNASTLLFYWMATDKKIVNWAEQKAKDFWNSIIGKKRVGLIARLDIYTPPSKIPAATDAAKDLIANIRAVMPADQAEYIFGK